MSFSFATEARSLWAAPFRELTHQLQETYGQNQVHLGFLERSEPDLGAVVEKIAQLGPGHVKVLRFFCPRGNISERTYLLFEDFSKQYQDLTFELMAPVGRQPVFMQMLEDLVGNNLKA